MSPDPPHDPLKDYVAGYPKLAARMGLRPETSIFRRFNTLNARNLLYMQADLASLEVRLNRMTTQDSVSDKGNKHHYAKCFGALQKSYVDGDQDQLDLIMLIKVRLKEYNEALLQLARLNKLVSPDQCDLHDLQCFLACEEMICKETGKIALEGEDAFSWDKSDIITLKEREKDDAFSKWIAEQTLFILKFFGRWMKKSSVHGEVVIYDSSILKTTFWVMGIFVSLLPIASILVLVHLKTLKAKLGTIAAFNVLISVCLTYFANAKRTDVFTVTAAFAAVQVVFIGTARTDSNLA